MEGYKKTETKVYKTTEFVDGRNGIRVCKMEVGSTVKVRDKRRDTIVETHVHQKQTTTYADSSTKSSGGKSCRKIGYTSAKNTGGTSKVSGSGGVNCEVVARYTGGVQSKNAGGTIKVSGSGGVNCEVVARYTGGVQIKIAGGTSKVSRSGGVNCDVVPRYTSSGKSSGVVARGSSSRAHGGSKKGDYAYY